MAKKILTEQDNATDLLTCEKEIVKVYGGGITEASNSEMRLLLNNNLAEVARDQFDVFLFMQSHNMYKIKPATEAEITAEKSKQATTKKELTNLK